MEQDLIEPQAVDLSDIEFSVEADDWIDVSALREMYHPFNSQVRDDHELTSIQRSIQKNGFTGTLIVVNKWNGKIVSGHGKVEACFKAGYRGKLPVVWREYKGEIEHRNAMLQFNMASGHQDPEKQKREIEALLAALPAEEVKSDLAITPDELQRILGLAYAVDDTREIEFDAGNATTDEDGSGSSSEDDDEEKEEDDPGDQASNVRMVYLFLSSENIDDFSRMTAELSKRYGTNTLTETIMEVVSREYHTGETTLHR